MVLGNLGAALILPPKGDGRADGVIRSDREPLDAFAVSCRVNRCLPFGDAAQMLLLCLACYLGTSAPAIAASGPNEPPPPLPEIQEADNRLPVGIYPLNPKAIRRQADRGDGREAVRVQVGRRVGT